MTFLQKLQSIHAGYRNVRDKPELMTKEAITRAALCAQCPHARKSWWRFGALTCTECGCPISAKVWSPYESCPIGKWKDVNPNDLINATNA